MIKRSNHQLSFTQWLHVHVRPRHHANSTCPQRQKASKHHPLKEHRHLSVLWIAFAVSIMLFSIVGPAASAATNAFIQSDWSGGVGQQDNQYTSTTTGIAASATETTLAQAENWCTTARCTTDWNKRKVLTITSNSAKTDYQVSFSIPHDSGMNASFNDLRFTSADGATDIPYWLTNTTDNTSTTAWLKLASLPAGDTTVMMYYDNAGAQSLSNGNDVFPFFDTFDAAPINTATWATPGMTGHASIVNGVLVFNKNSTGWNAGMMGRTGFIASEQYAFELDYAWRRNNTSYDAFMMGWTSSTTNPSYRAMPHALYQNGGGSSTSARVYTYENGGGRARNTLWDYNTLYNVSVRTKASGGALYYMKKATAANYTLAAETTTVPSGPVYPGFSLYNSEHHVDNVRVRKWSASEPTVTIANGHTNLIASSGQLVSKVFDAGTNRTLWKNITLTGEHLENVTVHIRTGNQPDMSDAVLFAGCSPIADTQAISANTCVTDTHRYVQYTLSLSDQNNLRPVVQSVSIGYDIEPEPQPEPESTPDPQPTPAPTSPPTNPPTANTTNNSTTNNITNNSSSTTNNNTYQTIQQRVGDRAPQVPSQQQPQSAPNITNNYANSNNVVDMTPFTSRLTAADARAKNHFLLHLGIGIAVISGILIIATILHSAYLRYLASDRRRSISLQPGVWKNILLIGLTVTLLVGVAVMGYATWRVFDLQ